jgi:two-component system sensor histidine kinase DesK
MIAVAARPTRHLLGFPGRARLFLFALHVPFVVGSALLLIVGFSGQAYHPAVVAALAIAAGALQLRHSFAAARGERPPAWPLTFVMLTLVVAVPNIWFPLNWASTAFYVMASGAMLLRGLPARVFVGGPLVVVPTVVGVHDYIVFGPWDSVGGFMNFLLVMAFAAGSLYGATQLIRAVDESYAIRVDLADQAVGEERIRISRDLHDLLGHSLSAVSLKGDLARALLPIAPEAAKAEIESLTSVARAALRDSRAVTHARHAVSLSTELDGAAALLDEASINTTIEVDLPGLRPPLEDVLAWATREGVTNVFRHSKADACSIRGERRNGSVRLEIMNDGVDRSGGEHQGGGLTGLAERVRAVSGQLSATNSDGQFHLIIELPEERE